MAMEKWKLCECAGLLGQAKAFQGYLDSGALEKWSSWISLGTWSLEMNKG
jgi:hypothetical protein